MTGISDSHWVGTWTTTPDPMEGMTLAGQTLRMITHISIGGARVRARISNAYGLRDLAVGVAHLVFRRRKRALSQSRCSLCRLTLTIWGRA